MAKKKPEYSISIRLGDKTLTGTGATALEALQAIKKPDKIVTKAIVTVSHGTLKKEILMWPVRAKRLFYNRLFQEIQCKQLVLGLK